MIKKEKKIKNTLLLIIFIIIVLSGILITFYQFKLVKNDINSDITIRNNNIHKTFKLFIKDLEEEVSNEINFLLSSKELKNAFFNKDRKKLYSLTKRFYDKIYRKNSYLKIMTFRLIDGSAFLRVHKPKIYGDKLNKKRKIILDTIKKQKIQSGFEIRKLKMTYTVVTPIFLENKLIGLIEVGMDPEYIVEKINNLFEIKSSILIKKDELDISMTDLKIKKEIANYFFIKGPKFVEENLYKLDLSKKDKRITYKDREYYIYLDINLYNHKKQVVAKMLISYDLTPYKDKFNVLFFKNLLAILFIMVLFFFILNLGFNYFLIEIDKLYRSVLEKDKMMFQQSKLVSMGEMIENIAHQWRQPLSLISTAASGLKLQKEYGVMDDKALDNTLDNIVKSTKYLSKTIDNFKDFIKNDKKACNFSINENIEKSLEFLKVSISLNNINIIKEYDENLFITNFENEFTQIFINIFNNSRDAFNENTDIKNRYFFVNISRDDEFAIVKIKDNAGGIPNEVISRIFEPYFTTKHKLIGVGLGLYMSYKIIEERMNGSISVENSDFLYEGKEYRGAEFTLRFFLK